MDPALDIEPLLTYLHPAVGPAKSPLQRFAQVVGVDGNHYPMITFAQAIEQQRGLESEPGDGFELSRWCWPFCSSSFRLISSKMEEQ